MKIKTYKGTTQRRVLIALLTNATVCARMIGKLEEGSFNNTAADMIAKWALQYYEKYDKPMGQAVERRFEYWAEKAKNNTLIDEVEDLLEKLNAEFESEDLNEEFILDEIQQFLKEVSIKRLISDLEGDIQSGDFEATDSRLTTFHAPKISGASGIDVFSDMSAIDTAFNESSEVLIRYPGAMGDFMQDSMERDGFVAFIGPEKRGKTFWLIDAAWTAVLQQRKVAFFSVGDMSQNQMLVRMGRRASNRPRKAMEYKYPLEINPPTEIGGLPSIRWERRTTLNELTPSDVRKRMQWIMKKKIHDHKTPLRLVTRPSSSLSVSEMRSILLGWAREGWVPDVVVIDYADILAPERGVADTRDQINTTWKKLRALSQEFHNLVITATQADAGSYGAPIIRRQNFSEDKRKLAHVTSFIGINQTEEEKQIGVFRLNQLAQRDGFYSENYCIYLASSLDCVKPAVRSCKPLSREEQECGSEE